MYVREGMYVIFQKIFSMSVYLNSFLFKYSICGRAYHFLDGKHILYSLCDVKCYG